MEETPSEFSSKPPSWPKAPASSGFVSVQSGSKSLKFAPTSLTDLSSGLFSRTRCEEAGAKGAVFNRFVGVRRRQGFFLVSATREHNAIRQKGGEKCMELLTKELEREFAKVGDQSDTRNPMIVAKFFNPCGGETWFACVYVPERRVFFGYVSLFGDYCDEWGYFSLDELQSVRGPLGLGIERDLYFTPERADTVLARFYRERGLKDPRSKK